MLLCSSTGEHYVLYQGRFLLLVDALVVLARSAVDVARTFMELKDGDHEAAYALCFPDLQTKFSNAEVLGTWSDGDRGGL